MKSATLTFLISCLLAGCSRATHPIFIDIATDTAETRYTLNNEPKTPTEIESYLKKVIETLTDDGIYRDGIFLRPDSRTSFVTVFDLLRRLKIAGVKSCEVIGSDTSTKAVLEHHSLVVTADSLRHKRLELSPPPEPPK